MWGAVGVALECDCRDRNFRSLRKPPFQIVVFCIAFGEAEPPAVIMNDDRDVIRIVKGGGAAVERGIVEVPFRRSELPDQFGKIAPVFVVTVAAAIGSEIKLVPPARPST